MLTSNLMLLLSVEEASYYYVNENGLEIFKNLNNENSYNIIYEYLFIVWNITNNSYLIEYFENDSKYIIDIIKIIKLNKVDKIIRMGVLILTNLTQSETCLGMMLDEDFGKTIDNLLNYKWSDFSIISILQKLYEILEKSKKTIK
jgi:hypothetical protein